MTTPAWHPDVLGPGFEALGIPLGDDPDGEGEITATLVRHSPAQASSTPGHATAGASRAASPATGRAVLYVHGFTDYFFQRHLAEHFTARGVAFYALDLRKCGRSLRPGQTPHFTRDLALYDAELAGALARIQGDTGARVLLMGHSTGGLILPLWLDRMRRAAAPPPAPVSGLVLNSPWFDLQGPSYLRSAGTVAVDVLGRARPTAVIPTALSEVYGAALSATHGGEWTYDLDWKPLTGFPVTAGWLRAVRHGHARLHRGLDVGVPSLVLRSTRSVFTTTPSPATRSADTVLDVDQIARWSGCLGGQNTVVPIDGALHDVFLSAPPVRAHAFRVLDRWVDAILPDAVPPGAGRSRAGAADPDRTAPGAAPGASDRHQCNESHEHAEENAR
ncbi:alpha/beta hydrolase [Tomitella fengzijianii]|uniref:Alpha/beta hydrolase n=1 Tax=Tomitella fengzijianii TaxID=2597660 RepID=A0A516X3M5_9ACTN|nr:alpha/beta hydrolase [Tomitella fengzijianii]QDQ97675.1 alpha/beta hydrolase [Tomitella fengzijianii]